MAKQAVYDYSTTASSNSDFDGTDSSGATGKVKDGDNYARSIASHIKGFANDLGGINTVAGTGDAITITLSAAPSALVDGMRLTFNASAANTTNVTLNVTPAGGAAFGSKKVLKWAAGVETALSANDIPAANALIELIYDTARDTAAGAWMLLGTSVAAATTSASGIVELATVAEALTGTDAVRAVTPAGLYYPTWHLSGLGLTNSGADSIVIAAGTARDSTDTANIALASSLTKSVAVAWAVGSAQGGLDTGAVGNSVYYLYLIKRVDTNVVDAVFSTSSSAPTLPTNYTLYRQIGSFVRVSAANNAPRSFADDRLGPTAWVAYTPTFTALGTVTNAAFLSRRNGDSLEVLGFFTAGVATASEMRISIGFNGTDGNVTTSSTKLPRAGTNLVGSATTSQTEAYTDNILAEQAKTYLTFGTSSNASGGLAKINGSTNFSTGVSCSMFARIPIQGW